MKQGKTLEIRKVSCGGIEIVYEENSIFGKRTYFRSFVIPKEMFTKLIELMKEKS